MKKFLSVLLALLMVMSTVSFAAPSAITVADNATDAADAKAETTDKAELAAVNDYGQLVYKIDFEQDGFALAAFQTASAQLTKNNIASYMDPAFDFSNVTTYTNAAGDGFSNASLVVEGDNTYIQGDVAAEYDGYFRMTKHSMSWPEGYYTFTVKVKKDAPTSGFARQCNDNKITMRDISSYINGSTDWQTVVYQTENVASGGAYDATANPGAIYGFFVTPNNAAAGTVAYDDWEVYYRPADTSKATVVIDPNGKAGSTGIEITGLTANSNVSVAELLAAAKAKDSAIAGLSLTANGEKLSAYSTVPVEYYTRLYAVYGVDEAALGTLLFDIDFEKYNTGDTVLDNQAVEEYASYSIANGEFKINWELGNTNGNKIADDNGNKYIRGGQGWAQFRIAGTTYGSTMPKGTYTVVARAIDFGTTARTLKAISQVDPRADAKELDPWAKKLNTWDDVAAEWDETSDRSDMTYYFIDGATTDVGFDDVKLYYKAADDATFTVTVKAIGNSTAADEYVTVNAGHSVTVSELKATMPGCMAIVEEKDSLVYLDDNAPITPEYNKTVYAVYGFDVTVHPNGNKDFTEDVVLSNLDPRHGYTVGTVIQLFNAQNITSRKLLGFSTSATGALIDENDVINKTQTLYAIWEADESEYGIKLFEIDFEKYNTGDIVPDGKAVETYDAYAITNGEFTINWQVGENKIAEDDGNKYIKGGQRFSQFIVNNTKYNDANAPMPEGTYTVVARTIDFENAGRTISATCQAYAGVTANTSRAMVDLFSGIKNEWDLVAGKWYGSSNDMSVYYNSDVTTEVGFDDIKLYYEAADNAVFSITVDTNGRTDKTNVVTPVNNGSRVTAGELAASMSGCVGISKTVDGEILDADYEIIPEYNMTFYAVWEYEESEYGTLLLEVDFEREGITFPTDTQYWRAPDIATSWNKDLVGQNIYVNIGTSSSGNRLANAEFVTENGNTYLSGDSVADYNFINILEYQHGIEWLNGTYTYVVDVKSSTDIKQYATHVNSHQTGVTILDTLRTGEGSADKWDTVVYQYNGEVSNAAEGSTGSIYVAPLATEAGKLSVDNIRLYFKTNETVFTVKNSGNPDVETIEIPVSTTNGITVQEMIEKIDDSNSNFELLGISDTPTGAVLDPETLIVPAYQRTFYMIWERTNDNPMLDNQLGKLLFSVDFEKEGISEWDGFSALDGDLKWGAGALVSDVATLYDKELFDGKNVRVLFLTNDRSRDHFNASVKEDELGDHFISGTNGAWTEVGTSHPDTKGTLNPQMYIMNNDSVVAGNGIYTVFIDVNGPEYGFSIRGYDMVTEYGAYGINHLTYEPEAWNYTPNEWNEFAFRYEVTDGSAIPSSCAYFNLKDYEQIVAFDNYKLYYKPYTATITLLPGEYAEFGTHYVENISTTGENTAQDILDALSDHFAAAGKTAVGLVDADGFELDLEAELVIPCDMTYTIIWGEDTHDYVETVKSNSIRYSSDESKKGIRFAATTKPEYALDVESVTEYGWIVTRKAFLDDAKISPTCFTRDSNVRMSSGQNYVEGGVEDFDGDGRKHFEQDAESITITMVVYGLNTPERMTETLVARPYMVVDGVTYYGQPWERSIYETALALKKKGYPNCDENVKAYIDYIISVVPDIDIDVEDMYN